MFWLIGKKLLQFTLKIFVFCVFKPVNAYMPSLLDSVVSLEISSAGSNTLYSFVPGRLAQLVTCLATDAGLTADPGVASFIPARSHTFEGIDHEIISKFKKGCCQLQAKVCA